MQKVIKFSKIWNGRNRTNGHIIFDTNIGILDLTSEQALDIAYSLVDSCGLDYSILDEVEERINGKEETDEDNE